MVRERERGRTGGVCGADNRRLISARHLHSRLAALTAPVTSANERAARHCSCCYQMGNTVYEGKPVDHTRHDEVS